MTNIEPEEKKIIYCRISFGDDDLLYFYRTDDESLRVGDRVIVPAGPDNIELAAIVREIRLYDLDKVPYPLDKTKQIISRQTEYEDGTSHNDFHGKSPTSSPEIDHVELDNTVTLFSIHKEGSSSSLKAHIENGCLILLGCLTGSVIVETWHDSTYEYIYNFSIEETNHLYECLKKDLNSEASLIKLIFEAFGGVDAEDKLTKYCKDNNIRYNFHVY